MRVTTRRISQTGDHGRYDVYADGVRIGRVVTDETKVWHGFIEGGVLVSAVGRKRDAVDAVAREYAKGKIS